MKKDKRGITLIELIITLGIMVIVIQIVYSLFFAGNKSFNISKNKGFAQQEVRIVTDFINNELKTAREISEEKLTKKSYSLSLNNNGKLVKKTYNEDGSEDISQERLLSNNLVEINFQREDADPKGIINIIINAVEGEMMKDKQEYSLSIDVLLENLSNYDERFDKNIIYYTKYE